MCPVTSRERSATARRRLDRAESAHRSEETEAVKEAPLRSPPPRLRRIVVWLALAVVLATAAAGYVARNRWLPQANRLIGAAQERLFHSQSGKDADAANEEADAHAGHDHGAGGGETSLELSPQAQKNIGLQLATVQLKDFDRTINVPAMVKERAGRTEIKVSTPMTGTITRVYPIQGEAVAAGQPLFDLRLTHEDLVDTQSEFLQTLEQLDVIEPEIARLDKITSSGAIAGKRLLEREYERQLTEARLRAQQEALILHGISE